MVVHIVDIDPQTHTRLKVDNSDSTRICLRIDFNIDWKTNRVRLFPFVFEPSATLVNSRGEMGPRVQIVRD